MASFTDFPNGLSNANDYLRDNVSSDAQLSTSVANVAGFMVSAEIDANLKEIICSLLAGRGLLLPNIQICISLNLKELLGSLIGTIQDTLYNALVSLDQAFDRFMDHLKLDEVLGRINNVIAEITNIANMINFCSAPINPIRIPNVLETAMDSFLGAGRSIVDSIGQIAPDQIGGCLIDGSFNGSIFQGGILQKISNNINDLDAIADTLINDINSVVTEIDDLIDRENSVQTNYDQGGSDLSESPRSTHDGIATLFNAQDEGIQGATGAAFKLKGIYDNLGSYPVQDSDGNVYNNILELICDADLLRILRRVTSPEPTIAEQIPVRNYCGEIIGYTQQISQQSDQNSVGTVPQVIDQPGFNAGGLPTNPINEAIAIGEAAGGGTVNTSVSNIYNYDGLTIFVANDTELLNSGAVTGQMVYRIDNGLTYLKNDQNLGTINDDYEIVGTIDFNTFLVDLNNNSGEGILTRDGDLAFYRSIVGTTGQISVNNGNGVIGDPTISIANNPILPGSDSVVLPKGTTSQRISTTNGALRYNSTTGNFEGYQNGGWFSFATGFSSILNGANLGSGSYPVFKQNNAGILEFHTLEVSGAITMGLASNIITVGENLTGSNLGTGSNVFKQRAANNFEFRTLTAGSNITLTQTANNIDIAATTELYFEGTTTTTNATSTEVLFNGARQTPASGSLWFVTVTAVANRSDANDATAIKIEGLVDNNSGTVTIVGTAGNKTTYNGTASTVNYDLLLDVVSNEFRVRVKGDAGHTVDWRVKLDYIESP